MTTKEKLAMLIVLLYPVSTCVIQWVIINRHSTGVALGQRPCYLSCHCKRCDVTVDWITRCSNM